MLQDVHWSGGGIGYFPTYALGNVISLQIWAKVREALPDLDAQMAAGELLELSDWLRDNLYALGRKLTPKETLARLTGSDAIDPQPYLAYLGDKMASRCVGVRDRRVDASRATRTRILDDVAERVLAELPAGAVLFDAHTHLGDDIDGMRGRPDEMLAMFDRVGITGSFTFCLDEPDRVPAFTAANDRTLAYAAASPDRIVPFVRLDLEERPIEEATRCLDLGARGIKLHPRAQKFSLGDERLDAVFALAVERDVPILIHGGRGLPPIGDHLAALVDRYADVRLIIAHAGIADLGGLAGHFAHVPGRLLRHLGVEHRRPARPDAPGRAAADPVRDRLPVRPAAEPAPARAPRRAARGLRRGRDPRACSGARRSRSRTATPLPTLTAPKGPDAISHSLPLARIHQYISMATPLLWMRQPGPGRGARARAQRRARGERRRRSRRRPDPPRALGRDRALGGDRRDRGSRGVGARSRGRRAMLVHIADILAVTTPVTAAMRLQPLLGLQLVRSPPRPPARSTSVASTVRFQALCGWPGRPASGSAGSSARGMFATPAATRRHASPRRAAATETSGNENACRSPVRR